MGYLNKEVFIEPLKYLIAINMSAINASWEKHELAQVEDCPATQASVKFGDLVITEVGQVTTPTHVQDPPSLQWGGEEGSFYSVFMTDPDAPSRKDQKFGEWYHWGVINVPGIFILLLVYVLISLLILNQLGQPEMHSFLQISVDIFPSWILFLILDICVEFDVAFNCSVNTDIFP